LDLYVDLSALAGVDNQTTLSFQWNHANLADPMFEVATVTTLTVQFGWDTDPSAAGLTEGTCSEAGVSTFSYMLTDTASGMNIDEATDIACEDALLWEDIPAGTYSIYVEGADSSGVKNWMQTCTDLVIADGEMMVYGCPIDDMSGG